MANSFTLRSTLSDGFTVDLPGEYPSLAHANNAAAQYMRHYSDPCGLGLHVSYVAVIDRSLVEAAR